MKRYNGAKNGRSCSNAPATYMTRPSPSSKEAICTVFCSAVVRVQRMNQSALLCDTLPTGMSNAEVQNPCVISS